MANEEPLPPLAVETDNDITDEEVLKAGTDDRRSKNWFWVFQVAWTDTGQSDGSSLFS